MWLNNAFVAGNAEIAAKDRKERKENPGKKSTADERRLTQIWPWASAHSVNIKTILPLAVSGCYLADQNPKDILCDLRSILICVNLRSSAVLFFCVLCDLSRLFLLTPFSVRRAEHPPR
jgi:hypothetical protein